MGIGEVSNFPELDVTEHDGVDEGLKLGGTLVTAAYAGQICGFR